MSTGYVIPICPGDDPGADWQEMGGDTHDNAAVAHVAWCPNHPGYWPNGPAMMWDALLRQLDPGEPVPLTLTSKALAFLDRTGSRRGGGAVITDGPGGWACGRCGFAWFGPAPDDGQCSNCRDLTAAEIADDDAQAQWGRESDAMWWETVTAWQAVNDAAARAGSEPVNSRTQPSPPEAGDRTPE